MRIQVKTTVAGGHRAVFHGFDQSLLLRLTPPGMRVQILHADPHHRVRGRIRLRVKILALIEQNWENEFSDYELREDECHFVDTGVKMPFPFKAWRHDHRVLHAGPGTATIIDDVTYSSGWLLVDWLMLPAVWGQFLYRRPIYRRVFGKPAK